MSRSLYMLFALAAYGIFFATFLYLIGFVGNISEVPRTVDRGPEAVTGTALVINIALIGLFGVQHSVMARRGFKEASAKFIPAPIERSLYVLLASLVLVVLFVFWRPIPGDLWRVEGPVGSAILWSLFALGWLIVLLSTFLISHFELFGLQQVYLHWRSRQAQAPQFSTPFFYRMVRHPLYSGFFLAFWATPVMSYGHLLLALGMSAYMLIAIRYEERDLVHLFGKDYEQYRQNVGMLAPRMRRPAR